MSAPRICPLTCNECTGSCDKECKFPFHRSTGPVRTVTRKEIVPGTYGPFDALEVMHHGNDGKIYVGIDGTVLYDASEIREFARLLTEIADAMEEAKP